MPEITKIKQCFLPSMVAGEYTVTAKQSIKNKNTLLQVVDKTETFGVDAARFSLNTTDIYSVYPPANTTGNYLDTFPHIVFNRRTLPWERTLDGKPPKFKQKKMSPKKELPIPWMSILLLDEDEMKDLKIKASTLADILPPTTLDSITRPEIKALGSGLTLMNWEKSSDPCLTIDISKTQFENYIPSLNSLSFSAHSKEVYITHKDKNGIDDVSDDNETGFFSVMVGHQLPKKTKSHTAVLVSLEGYANYLKESTNKKATKEIPDNNKVRLVVLANWNFANDGDITFNELINSVKVKSMTINNLTEKSKENSNPDLTHYLNFGYTAINHLMRNGAKNISWYRSPFTPYKINIKPKKISFSTSDNALRYDETTGLFDVSMAAAWQLGRILALQNQEFAKAMVHWNLNPYTEPTSEEIKKTSLKNSIQNWVEGNAQEEQKNIKKSKREIPLVAKDFLTSLYTLEGIPISYVIPDEKYLEKNNDKAGVLSLFYIDPDWIEALLDGALSIGRLQDTTSILEDLMLEKYMHHTEQSNLVTTGFLLRSNLISGWRGIEIKVYDKDNNILTSLRFGRINKDLFLGIFKGEIDKVVVKQPYEGLHFGLKNNGTNYTKAIKNDNGAINAENRIVINKNNGTLLDNFTIAPDILAKEIENKITKADCFTSAEYAYQMIDSPIEKTFQRTPNA